MAHMVESIAYAGETPWHGLGNQVSNDMSTDEMLVAAGLDWNVEKRQIEHIDSEGHRHKIKNTYALVRDSDDKCLTIVGPTYVPVQNSEAMGFFKQFVEAGHMSLETAGSLKGGRHIWVLANVNKSFKVKGVDEVKNYILLSQPHEIGRGMTIKYTSIRVVCNNTITMALRGSSNFRMPHVRKFDDNVAKAAQLALGITEELSGKFEQTANTLADSSYTDERLERFLTEVFDPKYAEIAKSTGTFDILKTQAAVRRVLELVDTQPGADLVSSKGTWWGALNACTYFIDHEWGRNPDSNLHSAWFGLRSGIKLRALEAAVEEAKR